MILPQAAKNQYGPPAEKSPPRKKVAQNFIIRNQQASHGDPKVLLAPTHSRVSGDGSEVCITHSSCRGVHATCVDVPISMPRGSAIPTCMETCTVEYLRIHSQTQVISAFVQQRHIRGCQDEQNLSDIANQAWNMQKRGA